MGQALYRKYRSKKLDEVIGQEHITSTLKNALKNGKISHAYLLTGPKGVGKTSVARILAHEVNGFKYEDNNVHLDIIEIDAASNRRIDEIRDLRDKVHIAPTSGKYKIYIIDEVHMLTKEAFNALLKTLEEPPEHAIFILATTESHKLPETIVSRTQRFSFKPIEKSKIAEHLRSIAKSERLQIDDEALELIAEHGEGSFRDSISLLDQVSATGSKISLKDVQQLLGIAPSQAIDVLLDAMSEGNPKAAVDCLESLFEQGYSASNIAKQLSTMLRSRLIEGNPLIGGTETTKLLKKLIEVPASAKPERMLELCILEAALHNEGFITSKTTVSAKAETSQPKIEQTVQSKVQSARKPDSHNSISNNQTFNLNSWSQILPTMKNRHSTLYSILRMSEPSYDNGTLTLGFKFAFHQKRVNEARNRQIIDDYIRRHTNESVQIVAIHSPVNSKLKSNPEEKKTAIKNISNIFGGAEVLDS